MGCPQQLMPLEPTDLTYRAYSYSPSTDHVVHDLSMRRNGKSLKERMSHRVIEKRRRDRMNMCLKELGDLIPPTHLKQGLSRTEKTEIIESAIKYIQDLQDLNKGSHCQCQQINADDEKTSDQMLNILHSRCSTDQRAYNFKKDIGQRFVCDQEKSSDSESTDGSIDLPGFVLHPSGNYYIPTTVKSSPNIAADCGDPLVHPVSISVKYNEHCSLRIQQTDDSSREFSS